MWMSILLTDIYSFNEGLYGFNITAESLSNTLATGTRGGGISGRAFNDLVRDGSGVGDPGLSGVTVFADVNGNGVLDAVEPSATTASDGSYTLAATPGSYNIIVVTPAQSAPTTPTVRPSDGRRRLIRQG